MVYTCIHYLFVFMDLFVSFWLHLYHSLDFRPPQVLGPLMASACCVLQLVMNLLNAGCGKFNTILGPWRPFFLGALAAWNLNMVYSNDEPEICSASLAGGFGTCFSFLHSVGNVIIPIDDVIFFRGIGRYTTNQINHVVSTWCLKTLPQTPYL